MNLKKIVDQVKDKAEDLKDMAGAKVKEARETLDKDHDNIPDALEGLAGKARTMASKAQEKAKKLSGQAKTKLEEVRDDAGKALDSARKSRNMSDKDSKQG